VDDTGDDGIGDVLGAGVAVLAGEVLGDDEGAGGLTVAGRDGNGLEADADFFKGRGHHHLAVESGGLDAGAETVVGVGVVVAPVDGEGAVAVEDIFGGGEEGFADFEELTGVATGLDAVGEGEAVEGVGLLLGLDHQVGVGDGGVGEQAVPGEGGSGGEAVPLGLQDGGAGVVVVEGELDRGIV
jgi:hypothetical protein